MLIILRSDCDNVNPSLVRAAWLFYGLPSRMVNSANEGTSHKPRAVLRDVGQKPSTEPPQWKLPLGDNRG